jgi:hypothetical protein
MLRTLLIVLLASWVLGCASLDRRTAPSPVSGLLDAAVASHSQEQQQEAFDKMVALGCSAVPDLVKHIDDSRPLPIPYLRIQNGPKHFEAFAQYGPAILTDAVATLLSALTCKDFGFIANGGTAEARKAVIAGWNEYVRTTPRERLCACGRA